MDAGRPQQGKGLAEDPAFGKGNDKLLHDGRAYAGEARSRQPQPPNCDNRA
jgi:hypothetical protein